MEITLTFARAKAGGTRLVIWVTRVMTPPRPRRTYLPSTVTGSVTGPVTPSPFPIHVTARADIARFVRAVNGMNHVMAGSFSCPMIHRMATMGFHLPSGKVDRVTWNMCTATVEGVPLVPKASLDHLMQALGKESTASTS